MNKALLILCACAMASVQARAQDIEVALSADKQRVRPFESVTLTVTVKNNLQRRPPVELTATATYTDTSGTQYTATSNTVTLQVIQPLNVSAVNISLPPGWILVSGTNPIPFDVELLEGETATQSISILYNPAGNTPKP